MTAPNQLSFLPDDYLERKIQRRTNTICAVLFLAVMGGVSSAFMLSEKATRAADAKYQATQQQFLTGAKRIDQVRQMQEKQARMARQAELTASLLERVPRSYILAEVTNSLPAGISLLDFNMDSKARVTATAAIDKTKTAYELKKAELEAKRTGAGTPGAASGPPLPAEPKLYDVTMKVTGVAATDVQVAQFLNKLSRSKLLKDVNLLISDEFTQGEDKLRRFQVEMSLDPTADVPSPGEGAKAQTTSVEIQK